jgi:CelD/BcsL family acetyltransferase involved in cellulose biosynthesis
MTAVRPARPDGALTVALTWGDTPELASAWEGLHARQPWPDPAQGLPYHRFIHEVFAPPGRPGCLVARRGGEIVGLLPVHLEHRRLGPLRQRRLLCGLGWHGVVADPLIAPGEEAGVGHAFAARLASCAAWDAVHIWRLSATSPLLTDLVPPLAADVASQDWSVRFAAGDGPQRGRDAREMRRQLRLLGREGSVAITRVTDGAASAELARHFSQMHSSLKAVQNQRQIFEESPGAHDRFPAAWGNLSRAGHAATWVIHLDGRPVALLLELLGHGITRAWRAARDPALHRFGLGIALVDHAITASRDRGDAHYALGPGDEAYKRTWVESPTPSYRCRALASGWRSLPVRLYGRLSGRSIA